MQGYQPRSMIPNYVNPQSPAVNYRARVYGVSPRQNLPNHLARRLAQGASTFT